MPTSFNYVNIYDIKRYAIRNTLNEIRHDVRDVNARQTKPKSIADKIKIDRGGKKKKIHTNSLIKNESCNRNVFC